MLGHRLVIVSDAHLGARTAELEAAFIEFLEAVPTLGDSLLINGDLFEFWFEYRRVVPRTGFHVLAALAALRKKIPIVAMGGNHDRWGESFWWKDLRIDFHVKPVRLAVGRRAVLAVHGDGITENHWSAVLLHRITSHPMTIGLFRSIHPDLGFWIADRLSNGLGYSERDPAVMDRAAQRQREWAEARLAEDPTLGLVVMGHTHRPALSEPSPGRQYLNPGAWLDGYRFAVATESGAELRRFRQD